MRGKFTNVRRGAAGRLIEERNLGPRERSRRRMWLTGILAAILMLTINSARPKTFRNSDSQPARSLIQFTNVTESAGIRFAHYRGNDGIPINREIFGPGVCVADFDDDGYQDIYFVNGRDLYNRGIEARNALYQNNGDGTFRDVTLAAGVPGTGYGLGCVWGDYDNDGFPDLYVTQYGRNVLYHNNGDGTFTDVTDKAGVAGLDYGAQFHSGATYTIQASVAENGASVSSNGKVCLPNWN